MRRGEKLGDERDTVISKQELDRVQYQHKLNVEAGRLIVGRVWFEVDAYGAAVVGIRASILLGLRSGSIGQGTETQTLVKMWAILEKLDPALAEEGKNCECGNHCYLIVGGGPGNYDVAWAHEPRECPFGCEDCENDA